ncbi:MAG: acetyl-CoA carboxylase biotin carboxyl carrier protein [Pseudomonadota bacterium]
MSEEKYAADIAFIRALAELLKETDLAEIEVERKFGEDDELEVRVSRQGPMISSPMPVYAAPAAPAPVAAAPAPAAPAAAPTPAAPAASNDPADMPGAVTSPMVGTVYLQAEPGTPPFVSVGTEVSEGQTLLIIEAMKTMNQIPSPRAGTVKRILIDDASPVEFGAPLMIIE